jgi:hypothetical protein
MGRVNSTAKKKREPVEIKTGMLMFRVYCSGVRGFLGESCFTPQGPAVNGNCESGQAFESNAKGQKSQIPVTAFCN